MARQNLLVATVNAALERGLITLKREPVVSTAFEFNLGVYPVAASVSDAGFGEVSIHAIANPTELGRQHVRSAIFHGWQRYGGAITNAWLERRTGKYLQSGVAYHGTKAVTEYLSGLIITPNGFGTKPTKDGYDWHKECESVFGPPVRQIKPVQPPQDVTNIAINYDNLRASFEPMGLCPNGFSDDAEKRAASWGRRTDPSLVREITSAIEWLKLCERAEKIYRSQTSYGLKHEAERWCREQGHSSGGYISNGALLMAAFILGFEVYRPMIPANFPNGFLNISRYRPQANHEK
jgi:hypothetical protein